MLKRNSRIVSVIIPFLMGTLLIAFPTYSNAQMAKDFDVMSESVPVVKGRCVKPLVIMEAGGPGVRLLEPTTLLVALPIINNGKITAQDVELTQITIPEGILISPSSLPFNLGTIPADGSVILDAEFSPESNPFTPGASYPLTVEGTYSIKGKTYCFNLEADIVIPPSAPGFSTLNTVEVLSDNVSGDGFAHQPKDFDGQVNTPRWTVPTAPFVPGVTPPEATNILFAPVTMTPTASKDDADRQGSVVFEINNGLGLASGNINGKVGTTAEPSGAVGGGVVFVTTNWTAAYSQDGGLTFTQLDPTTIFPNDAVGFCCDQIVQYVPGIDRFIWLLQGGNGYRLAVASPQQIIDSNATAWTYWNLTPDVFGQPAGTGLDYPDLSVGNNHLYMSWDAGAGCPAGCSQGFQVARTSLTGLENGGSITIEFTNPSDGPMAWGSHLAQNTGDEIFWAGHNDNSNIRVFSLEENSNTYFWRDVVISSWANNAPTSITPDGNDWLAKNFNGPGGNSFPRNGIIGATRAGDQIWFAWTAGTDSNFPQAHVEMVTLDRNNDFESIQQVQIWNDDYAFAYPALATNACTLEVGLSLEFGGNGKYYENHVVGFWGDFMTYVTTDSNLGTNRYGDYVTIRQAPATQEDPGNLFAAFGYGLNSCIPPAIGRQTDVRYVLFGRPASSCMIIE